MTEQRTEEWFAKRAGKFTGSRFAALMAKGRGGQPSATRANLLVQLAVERITGQCAEGYSNAAMRRGTELEPEALLAYEMHTGQIVTPIDFVDHPRIPMVGVSPDGLVGGDGLVEIKCPDAMARHYGALLSGDHADEYRWQIQGQLWVTGRAWCDAVSFDPRFPAGKQLAITRVLPSTDDFAALAAAVALAEREVVEIVNQLGETK